MKGRTIYCIYQEEYSCGGTNLADLELQRQEMREDAEQQGTGEEDYARCRLGLQLACNGPKKAEEGRRLFLVPPFRLSDSADAKIEWTCGDYFYSERTIRSYRPRATGPAGAPKTPMGVPSRGRSFAILVNGPKIFSLIAAVPRTRFCRRHDAWLVRDQHCLVCSRP